MYMCMSFPTSDAVQAMDSISSYGLLGEDLMHARKMHP